MKELQMSRNEKILYTLYKLFKKNKKSIRFEDIVVALFKAYPETFHLKGYSEYPDSGDLVHKPLYEFRKKGLVEAGNKMFSLTSYGLEMGEKMENLLKDKIVSKSPSRLSHFVDREVNRISRLESFGFFMNQKLDKILDTDLYDYLDVTVRTGRNDFLGRVKTLDKVMADLESVENGKYKEIIKFHNYMLEKFKDVINYMTTH
ncbi:MAG: hypothetical protein WCX95_01860 [Candidatus Gracilibacteria bacterium]